MEYNKNLTNERINIDRNDGSSVELSADTTRNFINFFPIVCPSNQMDVIR